MAAARRKSCCALQSRMFASCGPSTSRRWWWPAAPYPPRRCPNYRRRTATCPCWVWWSRPAAAPRRPRGTSGWGSSPLPPPCAPAPMSAPSPDWTGISPLSVRRAPCLCRWWRTAGSSRAIPSSKRWRGSIWSRCGIPASTPSSWAVPTIRCWRRSSAVSWGRM